MRTQRKAQDFAPIHLAPTDSLQVTYEQPGIAPVVVHAEAVGRPLIVNRIVTEDITDEVGMTDGIAITVGTKNAP